MNNYSFYFLMAHNFAYAANKLETVANICDQVWHDEMNKLNLPSDKFVEVNQTIVMHIAEQDRSCRYVSVYLFAHSLELSLKGIYYKELEEKDHFLDKHQISKLYEKVKNHLLSIPFNTSELEKLFPTIDEMLLWAGRYPTPKNNTKIINKAKENLTEINYQGDFRCLSNIVEAINHSVSNCGGIALMKNFLKYVLDNFSPF